MTDKTEPELTDLDQADLIQLFSEPDAVKPPEYHTILEVWREVLRPAAGEATTKPSPQWCNRMVQSYAGVRYQDMLDFRDLYFGRLIHLADLLNEEIATDDDCLTYSKPEDDVLENAGHYKNLLLVWQQAILQWELDWDCQNPNAAAELGVISEVHKVFFGPEGLTNFLDNVGFQFSEADQQELADGLNELREAAQ